METKKESKFVELMGELRQEAKRTGIPVLAIGQPDGGHLAMALECTSGDAPAGGEDADLGGLLKDVSKN